MNEFYRVVDQDKGRRKYQNLRQRTDGQWEALIRLKSDGSEDPSCWNMSYRQQQANEGKQESKKSDKSSSKKKKKGYFGLSRWNPVCWILWILSLPFKLVWFVLKMLGIAAIIRFFFGGKD